MPLKAPLRAVNRWLGPDAMVYSIAWALQTARLQKLLVARQFTR